MKKQKISTNSKTKRKIRKSAENKGSESIFEKLKNNHLLMMIVCCGAPLLILWSAVYFFGLSRTYLFWFMILLCPLMHYFMIKDMHKEETGKSKKRNGGCH